MTYRILNQAPQYLLPDGSVNAGGSLTFYLPDLTTPKDTWSDPDMATLNANPVLLDSAGRTVTDVWGDGEYGVVMKDAEGVTIWTRSPVNNGAAAGATIPPLVNGQFLSNDGSNLAWQPVLQVPDPTGLANYVLTSDGTGVPVWQQQTEPPTPTEPDIVVGADFFRAGISSDDNKYFVQTGTGTAPATGLLNSSVGVTFDTPFDSLWAVLVTPTTAGVSSLTPPGLPAWGVTGYTPGSPSSSVTVNFRIATDSGGGSSNNINNPVPFVWVAFGTVEVPPP